MEKDMEEGMVMAKDMAMVDMENDMVVMGEDTNIVGMEKDMAIIKFFCHDKESI